VIHLGRGDHNAYTQVSGAQSQLVLTTEQRDLHVWVTPDMNTSLHCHKIASNTYQVLGRLKRSFKSRQPSTFTMLYKSLVRPHLEYWAIIWSPKDIEILDRVQRRATKLITSISTLNYEARLEKLQLYSFYCRRQRGDLIEAFKILNSYYHIDSNDIFTLQHDTNTRGHEIKLFKPKIMNSNGQHFF